MGTKDLPIPEEDLLIPEEEDLPIPEEEDLPISEEEEDLLIPEEEDLLIPEEEDPLIPEEEYLLIPEEEDHGNAFMMCTQHNTKSSDSLAQKEEYPLEKSPGHVQVRIGGFRARRVFWERYFIFLSHIWQVVF